MRTVLLSLLTITLFTCSKKGDLKSTEIDSTVILIDIDTVNYDQVFTRKVNKLDFNSLEIKSIDKIIVSDLLDSLNKFKLISKDIFKKNLDGIPISLSYPYAKVLFNNSSDFYLVEFHEKTGYWFISIL